MVVKEKLLRGSGFAADQHPSRVFSVLLQSSSPLNVKDRSYVPHSSFPVRHLPS